MRAEKRGCAAACPSRITIETPDMTRLFAVLFVTLAVAGSSAAIAHSHKKKGVEVVHPWTAATQSDAVQSVPVYMTIKNAGGGSERLLSASSPIAEKVELVTTGGAGTREFAVAAGKSLDLKRDGPHLKLSGVKKRLDAYGDFKLNLVF